VHSGDAGVLDSVISCSTGYSIPSRRRKRMPKLTIIQAGNRHYYIKKVTDFYYKNYGWLANVSPSGPHSLCGNIKIALHTHTHTHTHAHAYRHTHIPLNVRI